MKKAWAAFLILIFGLALTHSPVFAQGQPPVSEDDINRIARGLYCPVCENVPLDACSTRACSQWRDLIREKLELGWSDESIKSYFAEQYGMSVLPIPPRKGVFWLLYVLPPLFMLVGFALWFGMIRHENRKVEKLAPEDGIVEGDILHKLILTQEETKDSDE